MNLEEAIEFVQIKEQIMRYCKTKSACQMVENIRMSVDFAFITSQLRLAYQMRSLLMDVEQPPSAGFIDMTEVLRPLSVKNTCIELENMPNLAKSLECIVQILVFVGKKDKEKIPDIKKWIENIDSSGEILHAAKQILHVINKIMDSSGEILPSCSPNLQQIVTSLHSKNLQVQKTIKQIMTQCKKNGFANENDEVSVRNDAFVVPIKASYKRNVKGILHDCSQTGQTFYIEPQEIVNLNFEIKELKLQKQREFHKILMEFSDLLRKNLNMLLSAYEMLVQMDFLRSKALYALEINASMPCVVENPACVWYGARHPLLEMALKKQNMRIVELNIELNDKQRIIVISGPNAGGKSVCLKTLALLQYMLQCGLLVPMKEISTVGIFEQIFLSIGDEQNLANGLSTYSSHLRNLALICEKSTHRTLFLVDEMGTGTEPEVGGAIAESILEHLNDVNAYGVVTTHYSVLKYLALKNENIVNAAMLFDTKSIKPLYTLTIGNPGSSFAFEIAKKTGLSEKIIDNAKRKLGNQSVKLEQQLQQIEVNKLESEMHLKNAQQYDEILYQTVQKYKAMSEKLEQEKKNILNNARNQAKEILLSANRQIERTIEEIKTSNADKKTVKQLKEKIKEKLNILESEINNEESVANNEQKKLKKQNIKIVGGEIGLNDYVLFEENENIGVVMGCNKNKLQIEVGNMLVQTTKNKVVKIDKHSYVKQMQDNNRNVQIRMSFDLNTMRQNFNGQLDLRGCRGEESLVKLEKFLDNARMLGEKQIKILHGTGNGVLKSLVRDYLHKQKEINFYYEDVRFGGEGITVVELL